MYELMQLTPHTYYLQSPAKIGLYVEDDGTAYLIDSGNDKEAGRKINQILKAQGWTLKAIINTHSNADHIGGNAFLQSRTGCVITGKGLENAFTQSPILEPSFLYGGFPPKPLTNKFLMAQPSEVSPMADIQLPEGFEVFPLPGHYFDMIGIRTPDDVVFLADALSGENIVAKYHINFIYDIKAYLETLDMIDTMQAKIFLPSHAEPFEDIRPLVEINRNKVLEIIELVKDLCAQPISTEELIKAVFDHYGLTMDFNQHVLVGSTLRSYLAYLLNAGCMEALFQDNRLLWRALEEA